MDTIIHIQKTNIQKTHIYVNKRIVCLGISIITNVCLQLTARNLDGFSNWYVTYIYPFWLNTLGRFSAIFPFSVIEILLLTGIVLLAFFTIRFFVRRIRRERTLPLLASGVLSILTITSMLLLIYTLTCGINYYNKTFSERNNISIQSYTVEELEHVCLLLTEAANQFGKEVDRDDSGITIVDENVSANAVAAMENLGTLYEGLSGYYPNPKPVLSSLLSVSQLSGIYSPFTIEANYNKDMQSYNIPFTACHELSHLKGFMQEEEANFIAYLACIDSNDADFQYSGTLLAWIYATNALYEQSAGKYNEIYAMLNDEIKKDLAANNTFWMEYDTIVAEVSDKVNDTYLKVNAQAEGIKSYNLMVDLLVAYYQ